MNPDTVDQEDYARIRAKLLDDAGIEDGQEISTADMGEMLEAACRWIADLDWISKASSEMADGCLDLIAEDLEAFGFDMTNVPAMFYNDVIRSLVKRERETGGWRMVSKELPRVGSTVRALTITGKVVEATRGQETWVDSAGADVGRVTHWKVKESGQGDRESA